MKIRHLLLYILTIIIISALILYIITQQHDLIRYLQNIDPSTIVCLILIIILFLAVNGLLLRELALKFNIILTFKEWMGLPAITAMGNYITPFSGGMIARATYLKSRHTFPYASFVSVFAASNLVFFWVAGLAGIISLILLDEKPEFFSQLTLFFAVVVLTISALTVLPSIKVPGCNIISTTINNSLDGWNLIKGDWRLLVKISCLTLIVILLNGLLFRVAFLALSDVTFPFGTILLISLFSSFSILIKITPGNVGISEAIITFSSGILGVGVGLGLMASLLIRAASLIPIFTLGPIFSFVLTRELTNRKN